MVMLWQRPEGLEINLAGIVIFRFGCFFYR